MVFEKLHSQTVLNLQENEKPAFSNSSGLKKNLRSRVGLMWMVDLTVKIKLFDQISPA